MVCERLKSKEFDCVLSSSLFEYHLKEICLSDEKIDKIIKLVNEDVIPQVSPSAHYDICFKTREEFHEAAMEEAEEFNSYDEEVEDADEALEAKHAKEVAQAKREGFDQGFEVGKSSGFKEGYNAGLRESYVLPN
jgi:flagellar biosynthesis/type III secretory pathway protein FliH